MNAPVIDLWAPILPTTEVMAWLNDNFPDAMLGYLRVFWKVEPTQESLRARLGRVAMTEQDAVAAIDAAGIRRTLITGFDEKSFAGRTFVENELVANLVERFPGKFIPFAGIDIGRRMDGVRELEHWIRERHFRGLSLRPFMIGHPPDHRLYYPFYAKCCELGIPLSIHASANWTQVSASELGHPRYLDVVASDFPELTIIVSHGGYPWVLDACLLAWKHPNVYLELAAHRPKYFATPGTGWEPLLRFGTTTIAHKILYGTGWFLIGRPPADLVAEMRELPIPAATLDLWLGGNAMRLFGETQRA